MMASMPSDHPSSPAAFRQASARSARPTAALRWQWLALLCLGLGYGAASTAQATDLQPFVASYEAFHNGKAAGTASMRVVRRDDAQWRVDLAIHGNRGFAGIVGLNIEQSTVFDEAGGHFRPLSQSTTRKVALFRRNTVGTYDWQARTAQWTGDVKRERREAVPLQPGDMSGLLINLALIRDARPGQALHYRFVDAGRIRDHDYQVAAETEAVQVGELSYEAMRVDRTNGGNDETIVWVADGVPTPIRILQREDGQDGIDLRLIEYQGAP
jgi:hypothetical protein